LTIGAVHIFDMVPEKKVKIEHLNTTPAVDVAYKMNDEGEYVVIDFSETAERVTPSVVSIRSTQAQDYTARQGGVPDQYRDFFGDEFFKRFFGPQQQGPRSPAPRVAGGSGVIISEDGYIVTNNHVIDNATDIEVVLSDNRNYKATVIGTDPTTDLALIQIKEKGLPAIQIDNSDQVKIGEWVMAVGNPYNLTSTVTAGIVSAKGRNINILREQYAIESFIQTDAAINPGNSGGALVNLQGGLVGINTAIASPTGAYSGYGFAVPSNIVTKVVDDLIKYGTVQRGYLGVTIRGLTGNFAEEKDIDLTEGVYVDSVVANSAAASAGIQKGDVILEVDNTQVKSSAELIEQIARRRPGDEVNVLVYRDGKEKSFDVVLKDRQGRARKITGEREKALAALGATFETVDESLADRLGIKGGVKVSELYAGKLQRETDLREGFIITKADGKDVKNVEQLTQILENKEGGVLLEGIYEDRPGTFYYAFGM